jgi:hypothetical protein
MSYICVQSKSLQINYKTTSWDVSYLAGDAWNYVLENIWQVLNPQDPKNTPEILEV